MRNSRLITQQSEKAGTLKILHRTPPKKKTDLIKGNKINTICFKTKRKERNGSKSYIFPFLCKEGSGIFCLQSNMAQK